MDSSPGRMPRWERLRPSVNPSPGALGSEHVAREKAAARSSTVRSGKNLVALAGMPDGVGTVDAGWKKIRCGNRRAGRSRLVRCEMGIGIIAEARDRPGCTGAENLGWTDGMIGPRCGLVSVRNGTALGTPKIVGRDSPIVANGMGSLDMNTTDPDRCGPATIAARNSIVTSGTPARQSGC